MFIEILFKILLFKGGVLIYAEHCSCESVTSLWMMETLSMASVIQYVILSQLLDGDLGLHQVVFQRADLSTQRSLLLFVALSLKHKEPALMYTIAKSIGTLF